MLFDILERAAPLDEYCNKVKSGKGPTDRDVSRSRLPLNKASLKFNFSSFKGDKKYLTKLEVIEGMQDWTLKGYEWNHPGPGRIHRRLGYLT